MGMFDYVNLRIRCPICKSFIDGFQTKDSHCIMNIVEVEEINNFYAHCSKCHSWIEFNRKKEQSARFLEFDKLERDFDIVVKEEKMRDNKKEMWQ
ncbi:MAG: hypothetical protein M0R17_05780 [Candidatus Omnitrophica bacterium]|jgi:hypothetical protein|nr:hypothetical protein [Candidatus Omnitrophota bacterium]